jgi:hypothetical protein
MSKHTAGPWVVRGGYSIYANGGKTPVAEACLDASVDANDEANAKHIVACVNACEGLPDGCLDGGWTALGASQYAKKLEAINAELLGALIQAVAWMDGEQTPINALVHARSIIAKAKGEQA